MSLAALAASGIQTTVLSGSLLLAMPLALAAGAVSFFSPCCLPLVPGYLSLVTGLTGEELAAGEEGGGDTSAGGSSRARVIVGTALFVLGFALVFTSYGALFGGLGFVLLRHQTVINRVFGMITILLGLTFLGVFSRFAFTGREFRIHRSPRAGLLGAPMLGVLFGVGWTPCIGPTLAAVLGLSAASGTALRGALLAFGYSVGLGFPFLVAGLAFRKAARAFAVVRRHYVWVLRAGGTLLVTIGVLETTGVWASLIARLQGVISGYATPL